MSTTSANRNPVEALAEEFLERKRRGEDATPEEYARQHPDLADEILALFPALLLMEDLGGDSADRTGSVLTGGGALRGTTSGRLGEFRLLREVGRGGMGVVYEAEQESLGRRVALKVLPSGTITDIRQLRRFEREARSAARLHHTNIVPVFGVGQHEGTHFYIMQLIQGQGLDAVLAELRRLRHSRTDKPLRQPKAAATDHRLAAADIALSLATGRFAPGMGNGDPQVGTDTLPWSPSEPRPDEPPPSPSVSGLTSLSGATDLSSLSETDRRFTLGVARIGMQAAEALAYAHGQGILHRDIKPSNLLLDRAGTVWLADFGLAKAMGMEDITHTGDVVGTVRYIAPERFSGEGDGRADVYSLGLTLYELLTLRPAFIEADRTKLIHQVTQQAPPRLRALNRAVPRDLETIIDKAMAREPGQRYATAGALAEDLRRFIEGRPILARRAAPPERAWRWCKRNPAVALLACGIALTLLLGTAAATTFAIQARSNAAAARNYARLATEEAERTREEARKATDQALRADREARRARDEKLLSDHRLYLAEMSLAHQAWQQGQIDVVEHYLQAYDSTRSENPDPRGFEWFYLHRRCQSELRILRGHTNNVMGLAFSPDGRRIASASEDRTVKLWDTATGQDILTFRGHTSNVIDLAFSPDGRRIASAGMDRDVRVWDADTGREVLILRGHKGWVLGVAFSRDGRRIASSGDDRTVRVWDSATGQELLTMRGHSDSVWDVAFSPDGRRIASASADSTVKLWDTATGQVLLTMRGHRGPVWGVAFSPDGQHIASAGTDLTVKLWNTTTGQDPLTIRGHSARVLNVAYSPDGRRIASTSEDRTVRLWDTVTGQELLALRGHRDLVWGVAFSPDGRRVASASNDRTVRLWETSAEQGVTSLSGNASQVTGLAVSPDGRRIAAADSNGIVRLWDATTGQEILTLRGHAAGVESIAFSPDGLQIASAGIDHTVKLWDAATGQNLLTLRGHRGFVWGVVYSPDGRRIASAINDHTIKLWDAATGREVLTWRGHSREVSKVEFSPDGRQLASISGDGTINLWDAATGRETLTLRGHPEGVRGVAFSPDSQRIASTGVDRTVRLWDVMTGQNLLVMRGHAAAVYSVAFSPDSQRIASSSDDMTVRLWDATTGQEILALRGHADRVSCVTFSPDGGTIVSGSWDGTVKLWETAPLTLERQVLSEARGLVAFLFAQSLPTTDVLARIRRDVTISDPVRKRALDLAEPYGRSLAVHEAERVLFSQLSQGILRPVIRENLRTDPTLSDPVRQQALALLEQVPESPSILNAASRKVVRQAGAGAAAYHRALQAAEAANRVVPYDGSLLTTVGMAQYRLEKYQAAAATLTEADRLNTADESSSSPATLAFLALAEHRLGRLGEARATLSRLREGMKQPWWAEDEEARSYLREAEIIDLDQSFPPDPFGP